MIHLSSRTVGARSRYIYTVYDVRSQRVAHRFETFDDRTLQLKWSHQDDFVAHLERSPGGGRARKDRIVVYDAKANFEVKCRITEANLYDFEWDPNDNVMLYYAKTDRKVERDVWKENEVTGEWEEIQETIITNAETVVYAVSVPALQLLRSKIYHNADDFRIVWHPDGLYFAALVEHRQYRNDKLIDLVTSVDLYHLKARDVPVENFELKMQKIEKFVWEPTGNRFVVVSLQHVVEEEEDYYYRRREEFMRPPEPEKRSLRLYRVDEAQHRVVHTIELTDKSVIHAEWSPEGRFFVLGIEMGGQKSLFHFYDTHGSSMVEIGRADHFMSTSFGWDASGRYFMAATLCSKSMDSNSFTVWNIGGKVVLERKFARLWAFAWRRKPRHLLTSRDLGRLKNEFPKFVRRFSRIQKQKKRQKKKELASGLQERQDAFDLLQQQIKASIGVRRQCLISMKQLPPPEQKKVVTLTRTVERVVEEKIEEVEDEGPE